MTNIMNVNIPIHCFDTDMEHDKEVSIPDNSVRFFMQQIATLATLIGHYEQNF